MDLLHAGEWLNDSIINSFVSLLVATLAPRNYSTDYVPLSSLAFEKLMNNKTTISNMKRVFSKLEKKFSEDSQHHFIVGPVNVGNSHWILAAFILHNM